MSKVRKGWTIFFFLSLCLYLLSITPAGAQSYLYPQSNQNYANLFWNQSSFGPFSSPYYPSGQIWNPNLSNAYPQFGIFPSVYQSGSSQTTQMLEGEILVNFADDVTIEDHGGSPTTNKSKINELIGKYGIYAIEPSSSGAFYIVKFSKNHDVNDVQSAFEDLNEHVKSAEPNLVRRAHTGSNMSMGNWGLPQSTSFYTPLNYSLFGTGLSYGSQSSLYQNLPSTSSWLPRSLSPNLNYSSIWQSQPFTSLQSSYNPWQQFGWGTQPYLNPLNSFWI